MRKQCVLELVYYAITFIALLMLFEVTMFLINYAKGCLPIGSVHWGTEAFSIFK